MKVEKYSLKAENTLTYFEFVSDGPNGFIRKIVLFQETNEPNLYNLAFGDKVGEPNKLDDFAIFK